MVLHVALVSLKLDVIVFVCSNHVSSKSYSAEFRGREDILQRKMTIVLIN
jgi:hypothetical protein